MKGKTRALAALLMTLLLCACLMPAASAEQAIDPEAEGSIVLHMAYRGRPVTGGELRLVLVGTVEKDDDGWYFQLLPGLGGERLDQAALNSPDLAERLAAAPAVKDLPGQSKGFDAKGEARFDKDVGPGLYLLMQTKACPGFQAIRPVVVSVPVYNAQTGGYDYRVDASVKPALEQEAEATPTPAPTPTPSNRLPQTGQLKWPVPVLAGLGLLLVLIGVLLLRGRRKKRL